ncbi:uncharacterized protein LOC100575065 [Acyrthosiphon pisum]|uniref:Uncharacterized protein n=1 Tax=Acyrthosiphon pisum TaxID=7029 RepID=A0A8R2AEV2_ACYPI|nr:uncharacterized protein LOC100575065 [Acyrthosiphon pisum]|eukprot:XP_003246544.1 PREDICTED: uncharacterized protein LOC100575065 [Acyrthosiphon pisum]
MEVNAKVLFAFLLGVTTLASGFVIRPYENIDYEVPDYVPGGDKELDLEKLEPDIDLTDQDLPETTSTTVMDVTTISHTTASTVPTTPAGPTIVYDPDDSYDDCDCPPQFLIYIYDGISK